MRLLSSFMVALLLTGCGPKLELQKDDLTGDRFFSMHSNRLIAEKNCSDGALKMKCLEPDNKGQPSLVKATLEISHKGQRDYSINSNEKLALHIDGIPYQISIINSFKVAQEESESIPLHTGGMIGVVKEVTRRKIAFTLSQDIFKKLSQAKDAYFEISSGLSTSTSEDQNYPIILKLNPSNITIIQEFNNKCSTAFPTVQE